jgi:hypothetical protein
MCAERARVQRNGESPHTGPQVATGKAYNHAMSAKLGSTNRYLRDAAVRRKLIFKSVASSSAIEGIRAPFKKAAVAKKPARAVKR